MRIDNRELVFALFLLMFVVGIGFAVYFQESELAREELGFLSLEEGVEQFTVDPEESETGREVATDFLMGDEDPDDTLPGRDYGPLEGTYEEDRREEPVHPTGEGEIEVTEDGFQGLMPEEDFFVEYRLERDRIRGRQMDLLQEIINREHTGEELRERAQEALMRLVENMDRELEVENQIKARGFDDALVFISQDSVDAVVRTGELSENEVERLGDIIQRSTGVDLSKVSIATRSE